MSNTTLDFFLGKGITFPLEFNTKGGVVVKTEAELIKSSITNILSWPKRDRFFNPDFGSRLEELIEEPADSVTNSLAERFVKEAISTWEKRVELLDAVVESNTPEKITIFLSYIILSSKQEDSLIFPFYKDLPY